MPQNTRKGIFFDLGGTLVTAYPSVAEHITEALAELGHPVPHHEVAGALGRIPLEFEDPSKYGWSFSRSRSYEFWTQYYKRVLIEIGIPYHDRRSFTAHVYGRLSDPQSYALYPDVLPVLERLSRERYTLGLISNWEAWGKDLIPYLGIDRYFPTQVLSGVVRVEKPDTRIFTLALTEADIAPEQALYIGDSMHFDIEPAQAIGMQAVLIDRHATRNTANSATIRTLRELHDHGFLLR